MNRVVAVIVTFNRLALLKECIDAVRNQNDQQCDIIVVNNGSSDGTEEWLNTQRDIIAIHQDNVGGAGGFYSGMKCAFEKGYDWVWLMDDDGKPGKRQLYFLLTTSIERNIKIANALVIDNIDQNMLAFGFHHNGLLYTQVNQLECYDTFPQINPFNGTLIHRSIIKEIGFVKKEMFIWGDEQEYILRAKKNGFQVATIVKAIHYHPKNKGKKERIIPFLDKLEIIIKPQNLSHIYYRNLGYIHRTYDGMSLMIKTMTKYSLYFLLRFKLRETRKFLYYYIQGAKNIFR